MTIQWALSGRDLYSHAVNPVAEHPFSVLVAKCGHELAASVTLYDDPPGRKCPQCVSHQLARGAGGPPSCNCTRAQEVARLREMLHQLVGLAEKEDLNEVQLTNRVRALAHRARLELEGFLAKQVAELANRWIAAQLPDYRPVDRDRQPDA